MGKIKPSQTPSRKDPEKEPLAANCPRWDRCASRLRIKKIYKRFGDGLVCVTFFCRPAATHGVQILAFEPLRSVWCDVAWCGVTVTATATGGMGCDVM